tara:strand:+ start:1626 stop:2168 length:543 start_codon:yes stop_codon:yes gene_type:complete
MEDTDTRENILKKRLIRDKHKTQYYVWLYSQKEINIYEHISLIAAALNAAINFTITFLPDEYQELSLFITGIINIITLTFTAFYKIFTTKEVPIEKMVIAREWEKLNLEVTHLLNKLTFEQSETTLDNDKSIVNEYLKIHDNCNELTQRSPEISIKQMVKLKKKYYDEIEKLPNTNNIFK